MRYLKGGFALLAVTGALCAPAAYAQSRTAPSAWNDPYSKPSPDQQAIDLQTAIAIQQQRQGAYGPANNNTTIGTVNTTNTYNGPVNTSGSTNVVNSNSTSSTVSGSNITITNSSSQNAGPSSQGATSGVSTGNGNNINLGIAK